MPLFTLGRAEIVDRYIVEEGGPKPWIPGLLRPTGKRITLPAVSSWAEVTFIRCLVSLSGIW